MIRPFIKRFILPRFRARLAHVEGAEHIPDAPYIIAPNHVDFLDGFYIATVFVDARNHIPVFLTKTNNYSWTRTTIAIDPEAPGNVLDQAIERLRAGGVICNYPEGARNPGDRIGKGKTGTVRLALAAGVPIVPVGISGLEPSSYFFGALGRWLFQRQAVTIRVGAPLRPGHNPAPDERTLYEQTDVLMQRIAALCGKQH